MSGKVTVKPWKMASVIIAAVYSTGAVYTTWVMAPVQSQPEAVSVQSPSHRIALLTGQSPFLCPVTRIS